MKTILLTNDDGINADGLQILREVLSNLPDIRLIIVAPEGQRSATGHNMSLYNPVKVYVHDNDIYSIDGSPADCVKAGIGFTNGNIDLIISGINHGPNLGADIFYSGTVAAAREGAINNIQSIAVSFNKFKGDIDFGYAASITTKVVQRMLEQTFKEGVFLNLNFPDLNPEDVKGFRYTKLGRRIYNEKTDIRTSPYGQKYFWLNCEEITFKSIMGSDLNAVDEGYISLTPLSLDSTSYASLELMNKNDVFEKESLF